MKLNQRQITVLNDLMNVSSALNVSGGGLVQFFDGTSYTPNREGAVASPIILTHNLNIVSNLGTPVTASITTLFYENDVLIDAANANYELVGANGLKVKKNVPGGSSIVIKAISKFVDPGSGKLYERQNTVTLRTIIKAEAPFQMNLSQRGVVYFDGYRNPNTTAQVTASLKKGITDVTDFTGITFKWLNAAGLDAVENELYADAYTNGNRTLTVDKTYIDNETIKCEAWRGTELIAFDTVTFVRKFNSFRADVRIPELPIQAGVTTLNCSVIITDILGNIDVDAAFIVAWMVSEAGVVRQVASGASVQIPISAINMKAANLMIYPDVKRREAFAALTTEDIDELITDDLDNVLVVETYGA